MATTVPSEKIQTHGRNSTRKRELQDIRISPEPVPPEDVLLKGESDDDDDKTRARKKARREAFAVHYLEHGWVPIMTARLKGPFEKDWKNPWAKKKSRYVEEDLIQFGEESPSPTVRRASNRMAESRAIDRVSKTPSVLKTPSRTLFQDTTRSKLSSGASSKYGQPFVGITNQRKPSPIIMSVGRARQNSPSHQLYQQLDNATSQSLVDEPEQISESNLRLEEYLETIWNSANFNDDDDLPYVMEWHYTELESDIFNISRRKRSILYGQKPIILDDGRVNQFNASQLKDIRTKISRGVAKVQQRFDTIKAAQNTSDIIVRCEITGQLAQILEKIDHVQQLHLNARSLPRHSKSSVEAYTTLVKYQHWPTINSLSDSSESDESSDDERTEKGKRPNLLHHAPQHHINQKQLEQAIAKSSPDIQPRKGVKKERDSDSAEGSDLDLILEDQNHSAASEIDSEEELTVRAKNIAKKALSNLTLDTTREVHADKVQEVTADASDLAGITFSNDIPEPNIKPVDAELSSTSRPQLTHSGSTQVNTPGNKPFSASSSQGSPVDEVLRKHQEDQHPAQGSPTLEPLHEPNDLATAGRPEDVVVIELDSDSDTSKHDAQYQSTPQSTKSRNDETLHSIPQADASDITDAKDSNSLADKPDTIQPVEQSQSRIEKFTNYLQDVHTKVWKKTMQMSQNQSENHPSSDPSMKPPSSARIDIVQDINSDKNALADTSIQDRVLEKPSSASASTLGTRQILSHNETPSDPRLALKMKKERDALDAASSLLGAWDVEKEASAVR